LRRILTWVLAGLVSVGATMVIFLPASWMSTLIEIQTAGKLTLGDAQGTLWDGSAFIGGAATGNDPLTPLLPGRFSWQFSPLVMLGIVEIRLENPLAMVQPVNISGSWKQWQVSPGSIVLPAERLAVLGAPLNTVQPSGQMKLTWNLLKFTKMDGNIEISGTTNLEMNDIASRISPIRPLGSYNLSFDWEGKQASLNLKTNKGPMLLSGTGLIVNNRLQFSGTAEAEDGQEERLENFLSLLGQRRKVGNKTVVALEFR